MDRLQSLRTFLRVVDEGGFAAAARKLDVDPSVVTRLVSDLEKHLGARLLQRTTRRMALTAAGEEYLARVRPLLADLDEADASVQGKTTELRGRLRLLSQPALATHVLAPAVREFQSRYPDIQIDIRAIDLPDPPVEEFDLSFLNGAMPLPADIVVREVIQSNAVLCAAPSYLKAHGRPLKAEDLRGHFVLRLRSAAGRAPPIQLIDPTGAEPDYVVQAEASLVADHTDTLLRATLEGAGISSQAEDIAAPYLSAGQLERVLAPWITNRLSMVAAYPSRKFLPARARVFLDFIIEHVGAKMARLRASRERP